VVVLHPAAIAAALADRKHATPRRRTSPRHRDLLAVLFAAFRPRQRMNNGNSGHVGIPRPTRSRVIMAWWQVSWLADCHLYTTFPGNGFPVALMAETRRLQLRGQPPHFVSKHTPRVPSWPFSGTTEHNRRRCPY